MIRKIPAWALPQIIAAYYRGVTQLVLAKQWGVHPITIARIVQGRRRAR